MLSKRDAENARLREQRDQQLTELNERKQKEHVKLSSLNEFKSLAESRGASLLFYRFHQHLTYLRHCRSVSMSLSQNFQG